MAFCIITNGSDTNHLFATIKQGIENSILEVDGDYEYIDLHEFDFRICNRDKCNDVEVDIYSAFGCKKSKECIKKHNKELVEKIYGSLLEYENIVFMLDISNSRDNLFEFHILSEELRKKVYSEENAKRLFFHKKALYVVVDEKSYRHFDVRRVEELIKSFSIGCIDIFFVNQGNEYYMLNVLEVAIPSLNKFV